MPRAAELRATMERAAATTVRVAGVAISHPDRPIAEAPGSTKLDIVRYHERIAAWLLPHLAPRPLAVVRCTDGRIDRCFFQKHATTRSDVVGDDGSPPFMRIADVTDVVRAVQNGAYEFHTWGASFPRLERPDRITLDLDPDTALPWSAVQDAALQARALLESIELRAFVKTTGGKGVHIVVPVTRRHTWPEAKAFARCVALTLAARTPALFTATMSKDARGGRVYVDYLRNTHGATAVAAYSLRARPGLPVSMPISWREVEGGDVRGGRFHIGNAAAVVAQRRVDPWADYDRFRLTITASMRRAVAA